LTFVEPASPVSIPRPSAVSTVFNNQDLYWVEVQYIAANPVGMSQLKGLILQGSPSLGCKDVFLVGPHFLEETWSHPGCSVSPSNLGLHIDLLLQSDHYVITRYLLTYTGRRDR
jgi:hypothetical protein